MLQHPKGISFHTTVATSWLELPNKLCCNFSYCLSGEVVHWVGKDYISAELGFVQTASVAKCLQ